VQFRLNRWLYALCWTGSDRPSALFDRATAARLPGNARVRIETAADGTAALSLSALDKLDEPASLVALRAAAAARMPRVDLPEILLEMHARTGFAAGSTHASKRGARAGALATSICAVLLAEACNTGLEPLIRLDTPALRRSRLSWVRQNYIRADTLVRSNATLVAAQAAIPLARAWGGGDVASADGLRFVVPVRTIHSGPNPRYFGQERGVTYNNLTSDQFTGLGGIVVPGTLRDSLVLLSVLLEQETALQPTEVMTDTSAHTVMWTGQDRDPQAASRSGRRCSYGVRSHAANLCSWRRRQVSAPTGGARVSAARRRAWSRNASR